MATGVWNVQTMFEATVNHFAMPSPTLPTATPLVSFRHSHCLNQYYPGRPRIYGENTDFPEQAHPYKIRIHAEDFPYHISILGM